MHRSLFALPVALVLVACGSSSGSDDPVDPPPSDPVVFDASDATRAETGVAKWGFASSDGETVFHGYDARNVQLVEIRQTLSSVDAQTARVAIAMAGVASASETIDFAVKPAMGDMVTLSMVVSENTFADGSAAEQLLAHLGDDARSKIAVTTSGSSLTQSHPLDDALVAHCSDTVTACIDELIDARTAASGAASSCSILRTVGVPLFSTVAGALVGGLITSETGPGAILGAVAGGVSGATSFGPAALSCVLAQNSAKQTAQALSDCKSKQAATCTK